MTQRRSRTSTPSPHTCGKTLENKKFILLYAFNGTGKTRLSTAFKSLGKVVNTDGETEKRDTLYFNAFTEDLFMWDNDLENDRERKLTFNTDLELLRGPRVDGDGQSHPLRCSTATPTSTSGLPPPPGRWSSPESSG